MALFRIITKNKEQYIELFETLENHVCPEKMMGSYPNIYFNLALASSKEELMEELNKLYVGIFNEPEMLNGIKVVVIDGTDSSKALQYILDGGKCIYRYGWAYKGARARELSPEDAIKKFPGFSFGMGFYEMKWTKEDGTEVLEFNELGENDLW